jgi:ketosteroid isomerase-like protein
MRVVMARSDVMVVARQREEAVIRRLIEDWASAVRARKIRDVVAHHTDDVVMFDVPPPVTVRGISACREIWPPFFRWRREGKGTFDIVKLDITAGDMVAFATALLQCGSTAELAKNKRPRLRLTIGLRKVMTGGGSPTNITPSRPTHRVHLRRSARPPWARLRPRH